MHTAEDRDDVLELQAPNRLLFDARSEGIEAAKFWKDAFRKGRAIARAMPSSSGKRCRRARRNRNMSPGQEPFGMAAVWKLWKNPKTGLLERTFAIEIMAPIYDRMTTFLEPDDQEEYLAPDERPPVHLLRILLAEKMKAQLIDGTPISNAQVGLFDSQ